MKKSILPLIIVILLGCGIKKNLYGQTNELFRVTILGSGTPVPSIQRLGASTLVEAGKHKLLFDIGRGTSIRIQEYGLKLGDISGLFITHLHGDHVVGLPDFWLSGYHRGFFGGREGDLKTYGPIGTKKMTDGLMSAYSEVIYNWGIDFAKPGFDVKEFSTDTLIFQEGDLKVIAFKVEHSQKTNLDCYGYKVEYKNKSIVISGDTGYSKNLIKYSEGADLLIHEVFYVDESTFGQAFLKQLKISHTVPEVAAQIFNETNPKVAVAYHLTSKISPDVIEKIISKIYKGQLYMGHDLMSFNIGETVKMLPKALKQVTNR